MSQLERALWSALVAVAAVMATLALKQMTRANDISDRHATAAERIAMIQYHTWQEGKTNEPGR
ncbi:hypothetical protein N9937_00705 [bacterium]|nr:hypothetical protein [bacterium]